eukprot:9453595-Pyramimonas_sp.AAC.1
MKKLISHNEHRVSNQVTSLSEQHSDRDRALRYDLRVTYAYASRVLPADRKLSGAPITAQERKSNQTWRNKRSVLKMIMKKRSAENEHCTSTLKYTTERVNG